MFSCFILMVAHSNTLFLVMAESYSIVWISQMYNTICLSSHHLVNIVSNFEYCQQWCYKYFYTSFSSVDMFSFILGINLGMELLCHILFLYLTSWETTNMFSTVAAQFYIPTSSVLGLLFVHILGNACNFMLFD